MIFIGNMKIMYKRRSMSASFSYCLCTSIIIFVLSLMVWFCLYYVLRVLQVFVARHSRHLGHIHGLREQNGHPERTSDF